MWDKCPQCGTFFTTTGKLAKHMKKDHKNNTKKLFQCFICPMEYNSHMDLFHHLDLNHKGIPTELLENGTKSRETKRSLGDYMDNSKKGTIFECCECFEIFPDSEKLCTHRLKQHNMMLTPEAEKKVKELDAENPPQCNRCKLYFRSIITTKIENKMQFVCLDCYEKYYGTNALAKLMIGTPDEMVAQMRKPIKK